ncbi:MAG: uroporphyrinogen-III synthase, partial [Polyangiales bacterium]
SLFGAIAEEAQALARARIAFEIVPGVPAFVVAAARAGVLLDEGVAVLTGVGIVRIEGDSILDRDTETTAIPWPPRRGARLEVGTLAKLAEREGGQMLVVGGTPTLPWLETRPLFGRTVLITRAREQASETARAVRARGAIALEAPTIRVVAPEDEGPLRHAATALATYDFVAFTSANGVDRLFSAIADAGLDARAFRGAKIAAIGPGTARALERHGVRADLSPAEHRGEALAEEVLRALGSAARGKRVLLPRAAVARDAFPDALRAAGVEVDVVAAYRTVVPAQADIYEVRRLLESRSLDVVLFTASSTVEQLCALVPDATSALAAVPVIATIGPITSATCKRLGLRVDVEASPYTIAALLDALEAHFTPLA